MRNKKSLRKRNKYETKKVKSTKKIRKNKYTRKTNKKGGKVIGSGAYGCVFRPALPCKVGKDGKRPKNKVSKLMKKQNALKEMSENEIIDRIDPTFEFHLENPYMCELPEIYQDYVYTPEEEDDADLCQDLPKILKDEPIVIQQEDGGISLLDFIERYRITSPNVKELMKMMERCYSLVRGLEVMSKNSISHFDIKPENIVYNPMNNKVKYIDFGIAGTYKDILSRNYVFNQIYPWYPLEVFLVYDDYNNIKNSSLNDEDLRLFKVYVKDWYFQRYINSIFISDEDGSNIYTETFNHIDTYVDLANKNSETNFKTGIVEKVDIFSLGIVFMRLWNKYLKTTYRYMTQEELEEFIQNNNLSKERVFILKLYEIIYKMTKPVFIDRIGVDELVTMYNDLLSTIPYRSGTTTAIGQAQTSSSGWRNRIKGIFTRKNRS